MENELADKVGVWKKKERERKATNNMALAKWHEDVAQWMIEHN